MCICRNTFCCVLQQWPDKMQLGFSPSNFLSAYPHNILVALMSCLLLFPEVINSPFLLSRLSVQPAQCSSSPAHHGMACSYTFKISFLKQVHPSWTPLPFRTPSQGILPNSLLNRPESVLWNSKVPGMLSTLLYSVKALLFCGCCQWSVHKEQLCRAPPLAGSLTSVRRSSFTQSRNLLDFISVLSLLCYTFSRHLVS